MYDTVDGSFFGRMTGKPEVIDMAASSESDGKA
jgi:hypothetical protein